MKNQIFLVLGGARSGKSEFAEKLMYHSTGKRKGYIATSQIFDDEMRSSQALMTFFSTV